MANERTHLHPFRSYILVPLQRILGHQLLTVNTAPALTMQLMVSSVDFPQITEAVIVFATADEHNIEWMQM